MNERLSILSEKLNKIQIKEKPKTFLDVIEKTKDEVLTSSWVAFSINPKNTNKNIIEKILEITKNNRDECDFTKLIKDPENTFISINTEKWITNKSRVDIIVKFKKFWIIIENKVDSNENGDQSTRYEEDLKNINIPIKYICLKPNYNKCILKNKKFANLSYGELIEILKQVSEKDMKNKESYIYIKELIKHAEVHLMANNEIEISEEIQFYIDNKPEMDEIVKKYDEQCRNVREKLINKIKEKFNIQDNENDKYKVSERSTSYIQLWKTSWPKAIHYEIGYNLINIIGKSNKVTYRIDNESGSYRSIPRIEVKYEEEYEFDNIKNIEESIEKIADKLLEIANENDSIIDEKISKNI